MPQSSTFVACPACGHRVYHGARRCPICRRRMRLTAPEWLIIVGVPLLLMVAVWVAWMGIES